jgi:hypothetical protein
MHRDFMLRRILAIEAEAVEPYVLVLNYLWNEADIEPGHTKVCDLFDVSDPMAVDIADLLTPEPHQ